MKHTEVLALILALGYFWSLNIKYIPVFVGLNEAGAGDGNQTHVSIEDFIDHMTVDVGEAALDAVVVEGEAFVVNAEEVESGGVEVV